ncbi:MAG: hypothetical protein M0Z61_15670 [Nitrospiraceae bacterium]|nr:hypothetical protein [Nitrospiraceae bacterium]
MTLISESLDSVVVGHGMTESKIGDKWHAIVRYDCSHGFFHRDILSGKGGEVKQLIPIKNLRDALTYAEQDLKDRWEWYKEKFKRGMKQ